MWDLGAAECGGELRIAVHRSLDAQAPEESDVESAGSQSSRYQADDGFIVASDEEDAVEASADAEFSAEEPPARAVRPGHMSREAARAAVDSPSFLDGLGDAAGASDDEDEDEEEEPIRRKRQRR